MNRKERVHEHIDAIANEVLDEIKAREGLHPDRWVPATEIIHELELKFVCVPQAGKQYGEKGWFFAVVARLLEDRDLVEFRNDGSRSFYRSK